MRLHDHAVLATALASPGEVQPVFIFDTDILAAFPSPDDRRLSFIAATLCHMHQRLSARGGGMLVLHGSAREIMPRLAMALSASQIISAEDMEPATRARDEAVKRALPSTIRFVQVLDHLIQHPTSVVKGDGTPYKVFTPYAKAWHQRTTPLDHAECPVTDHGRYANVASLTSAALGLHCLDASQGPEALLLAIGYRYHPDPLWPVDAAPARLAAYAATHMASYHAKRDLLADDRTSRLSPYLRFGLVSIREAMRAASAIEGQGAATWIKELIWREFYAMILYHFPELVEQEFQPQYRGLPWMRTPSRTAAFIEGRTGYPVIDAAMRQLLAEGWMHNRARMIVASFMTKDLHLDWRIGEAHFAQYLMDYELASNNGGWQWAASTGTDAQPYFRVFNPYLQSAKFDPEGEYIRRYVPELRHLQGKDIHQPEGLMRPQGYPAPIVDHRTEKDAAVAMFKLPA